MLNNAEIGEINAWANVLQAVGQEGHDSSNANQKVLKEITLIVKEQLAIIRIE